MILAGGLGSLIATASSAAPSASPATARSPVSPAALQRIAAQAARTMGDPDPTSVQAVATSRGIADSALMGEKNTSWGPISSPVHVIIERGHFTAVSSPPGDKAPTGSTLAIIVDDHTGEVTDVGVTNRPLTVNSLR